MRKEKSNLMVGGCLMSYTKRCMVTHNYSVDLLRGLGAFGIVGCHLMLYPKTTGAAAITNLCDMFVGLFAALSGYWMGIKDLQVDDGSCGIGQCIVKRAKRIIPTYLAWTAIYILFGLCFDLLVRKGLSAKWLSPEFAVDALFFGGASCHLWFLACLFYSQVILFALVFVRRIVAWWHYIVVGFVLVAVAAYSPVECWWTFYPLRLFAFLVTGCGVAKLLQRRHRGMCGAWVVVLAVSVVSHFFAKGCLPQFIRDWFVVVPLLYVAVNTRLPEKFNSIAGIFGKTSMGVFLVHPIFAAGLGIVFKKLFLSPYGIVPWGLDWMVCWGCSFIVALTMVRMPVIKKIAS